MHRGPGTTQVVVICTSAVVRRLSFLWKVGSAPGPSDMTTRRFAHLWRAMGTVVLSSELSPVVANRTAPRGEFEEAGWAAGPSRLEAGWAEAASRVARPNPAPTPIIPPRRTPPPPTAGGDYRDKRHHGGY